MHIQRTEKYSLGQYDVDYDLDHGAHSHTLYISANEFKNSPIFTANWKIKVVYDRNIYMYVIFLEIHGFIPIPWPINEYSESL